MCVPFVISHQSFSTHSLEELLNDATEVWIVCKIGPCVDVCQSQATPWIVLREMKKQARDVQQWSRGI